MLSGSGCVLNMEIIWNHKRVIKSKTLRVGSLFFIFIFWIKKMNEKI